VSSVVAEEHHDPFVAHQFQNAEQQRESAILGMWLFLGTEVMFFGGMFVAYILFRVMYPGAFNAGSSALNVYMGTANTMVLLVSSLTMAMAVHSAQIGTKKKLINFLIATLVLGCVFLVVKGFEYHEKYAHGLIPGPNFHWDEHHHGPLPAGTTPGNVQIFFFLYFALTGVHAAHMIVGVGLLAVLIVMAYKDQFPVQRYMPIEISGFYWHFVDIVWVFLFPLLYLIAGLHT
jgi:cytochrome c oxidase subunit 3